jgi:hypothetical protein
MLNPLDPLRSGDPQKLAELQGLQTSLPQRIAEIEARIAALNNRGDTQGHGFIGNFFGDTVTEAQRVGLSKELAAAKAQLAGLPKEIAGMYSMTPEQYQQALTAQQNAAQTTPADGFHARSAPTRDRHGPRRTDADFEPSTVQLDEGSSFGPQPGAAGPGAIWRGQGERDRRRGAQGHHRVRPGLLLRGVRQGLFPELQHL